MQYTFSISLAVGTTSTGPLGLLRGGMGAPIIIYVTMDLGASDQTVVKKVGAEVGKGVRAKSEGLSGRHQSTRGVN